VGKAWSEFIQTGSFGGVEFDFVSTRDDHERDLDFQEFDGRDGAAIEDRKSKARRVDVTGVFVEDDYPDTMNALLAAIDKGGAQELVHPIFGSMPAVCQRGSVQHNAEESADSATVDLTFFEDTPVDVAPTTTTFAALAGAARAAAAAVTAAAAVFESATEAQSKAAAGELLDIDAYTASITGPGTEPTAEEEAAPGAAQDSAGMVVSSADRLELEGDELSVVDIQAEVNGTRSSIDATLSMIADFDTPEAFDLSQSLLFAADALGRFALKLIEAKPPLTVFEVDADINVLALAHALYRDSERVGELLALNNFDDPLIVPAGARVRGYAY
jgi:prophage DNA circulation protein